MRLAIAIGTHVKTGAIIVAVVNVGEPAEIPPAKPREAASAFTTWRR